MGEGDGGGGTSNNVYIRSDEYAWIPARLIEQDKDTAKVAVPQYNSEEEILSDGGKGAVGFKSMTVKLKDYAARTLPLQNVNKSGTLKEVDDMVDLPYLHEGAILYNMKARHCAGKPYTRVSDIVIAVNPYQWLTHLYTDEVRMHYAQKIVWEKSDRDPRKDLEPHIYEVSSLCYKGLALDNQNQSILVSGESGAGKTETVKIAMNHIASVQQDPSEASTGESLVVKRIVDSGPLLEAFGNAKTRRNDNSSRFGKYIMLQFTPSKKKDANSMPRAALAGSTCEVYLLEKSRVIFHDETERVYHVFYQLIDAPDEEKVKIWPKLKGTTIHSFKYVGTSPDVKIDGKTDAQWFFDVRDSLKLIGVEDDQFNMLFQAVSACLQIGNITFAPKPGDEEKTNITSKKELSDLAELIGCDENTLSLAFTERTIKTRGEEYKVPIKADAAKESADAFAKEIYAKLFLWLVRAINDSTTAENNMAGGGAGVTFGLIGLLDIFGFESFPVNGFEQLCINYCNEKLQQKFTQDIFRTVVEEYKAEGLNLDDIKYDDNSDVLQLIEGKLGLIKQLNEECVRPKGNDSAFVSKALQSNKTVPCLMHKNTFTKLEFGIAHYAGPVIYNATDFVIRNNDALPADMHAAAQTCKNEIVSKHLQNDKCSNQEAAKSAAAESSSKAPKRAKSSLATDTVMTKFQKQLTSLMTGLSTTSSRYIRCVKPNTRKAKLVMMHLTTIEQLRCAGVIAAVTISRSAYPNRITHEEVKAKYGMLHTGKKPKFDSIKDEVENLLEFMLNHLETKKKDGTASKAYAMGKTRSYFRAGALEYLELELAKIWDTWAVKLQQVIRSHICRRMILRQKYEKFASAVVPIQCAFRLALAVKRAAQAKKDKKRMKRLGKKSKKAAIRIQAIARGFIQRPRYREALRKKKEEEDLQNQLNKMEDKLREAEEQRKRDIEDAKFQFEQEMEEYKEKLEDQLRAEAEKKNKSAQQQTLIDESGKIIEYLRKENMKLRQQCESMKRDYKSLKENNARLMEANASASASFNQLNDHAKQLNATNARLIKNVDTYKKQLVKMKEDLKNRQAFYLAEAHARVAYQKTLARIVAQVQDKSRDAQLVEDVVIWALECEAEAKSERAALENAGQKAPPGQPSSNPAPSSMGKKKKGDDSDSDEDSDDD